MSEIGFLEEVMKRGFRGVSEWKEGREGLEKKRGVVVVRGGGFGERGEALERERD